MKSILYVGATLMIGASIYGFVDYKNNSHKKAFNDMYHEEKTDVVPVINKNDQTKTETMVLNKDQDQKAPVKNKTTKKEATIDPVKPVTDRIEGTETKGIGNASVDTKIAENKEPVKKIKKKKRLNRELFSRAPIREEEIVVDEKVKDAIEKPGKKDQ